MYKVKNPCLNTILLALLGRQNHFCRTKRVLRAFGGAVSVEGRQQGGRFVATGGKGYVRLDQTAVHTKCGTKCSRFVRLIP